MAESVIILMDNGSLRAGATLQLRELAAALSARVRGKVHPVSLLHSSKIAVDELGDEAAKTLVPFLRESRENGVDSFIVVPLFFGPSGALADYLPARVQALRDEGWSGLKVEVRETLVREDDSRVAEIMAGFVRQKLAEKGWENAAVAMCDHGTPAKAVNVVRELVAKQMQEILSDTGSTVKACSMERREGAEYDFNEPLLENLLGQAGFDQKVIVSLLFAAPGRHAGEDGDVAEICATAQALLPELETTMTDLVGSEVDSLVAILADRLLGK